MIIKGLSRRAIVALRGFHVEQLNSTMIGCCTAVVAILGGIVIGTVTFLAWLYIWG